MKSDTSLAYSFMWISTGAPASAAASRTERNSVSLAAVRAVTEK